MCRGGGEYDDNLFRIVGGSVSSHLQQGSIKEVEGVVAQWCNPLTLQPEQSGGVGSKPDRASPLERHDNVRSRTRLALSYFRDPSAWR